MAGRLYNYLRYDEDLEEEDVNMCRRTLRDSLDPFAIPAEDFQKLFRLPQEGVIYLTGVLTPQLGQPRRRTRIPVHLQLELQGESWARLFICHIPVELLLFTWVKFPMTDVEKQCIKIRFMEETGFPGVLGAVDSTHVAIVPPDQTREHIYLNRKGCHSKNVQTVRVCSETLVILSSHG